MCTFCQKCIGLYKSHPRYNNSDIGIYNTTLVNALADNHNYSVNLIYISNFQNKIAQNKLLDYIFFKSVFEHINKYISMCRSYSMTKHSKYSDSGRLLFSESLSVALCV